MQRINNFLINIALIMIIFKTTKNRLQNVHNKIRQKQVHMYFN